MTAAAGHPDPSDGGGPSPDWVDVVGVDELRGRRTLAVSHGTLQLCLLWHAEHDRPVAFDDVCVHKQRSLAKGVVLNGRLVCPGHQWAYDLATGYCRERDRHQPTYHTRVAGDRVLVDVSGPVPVEAAVQVTIDPT